MLYTLKLRVYLLYLMTKCVTAHNACLLSCATEQVAASFGSNREACDHFTKRFCNDGFHTNIQLYTHNSGRNVAAPCHMAFAFQLCIVHMQCYRNELLFQAMISQLLWKIWLVPQWGIQLPAQHSRHHPRHSPTPLLAQHQSQCTVLLLTQQQQQQQVQGLSHHLLLQPGHPL